MTLLFLMVMLFFFFLKKGCECVRMLASRGVNVLSFVDFPKEFQTFKSARVCLKPFVGSAGEWDASIK